MGSGLYREDDPGSRESLNPDQNRNAVQPSDPSDHLQETHYPRRDFLSFSTRREALLDTFIQLSIVP
jgi:hypothetical protein